MTTRRAILPLLLAVALQPLAARPQGTEVGRVVDDAKLRQLEGGGTAPLFDRAAQATVLVFIRPGQERSAEAVQAVARCQAALAGKPVRWVAIAPDLSDPAAAKATAGSGGAALIALLDEGDALYAALGVKTHPAVAVVDRGRRVVAFEPYLAIDYVDVLRARVRRALGEISDAEVAAALAPATSQLPGEDKIGVAKRHVHFGRKLLAARSFAQAHQNARKSLEIAPTAAGWALEGEIFAAEGNCPEAARCFGSALKLDPKEPVALARRDACR